MTPEAINTFLDGFFERLVLFCLFLVLLRGMFGK